MRVVFRNIGMRLFYYGFSTHCSFLTRRIYSPLYEQFIYLPIGRKGQDMEDRKRVSAQVIGANIRRIRLEHGETQQQLGELLGYGATTVANYESGYRLPDLETFFAIALHYGASLEDFMKEQDFDVHES